ncbi:protocatechuate 3,4-dioxygenase subunit alpha [Novosphingobium resinovorum]|uniref:protocatechuate 3,4-dioxygenase subunit alpha n=1 Tax=Novosphingobium TaxID=165696 RepID=UPI001B3C7138|nr:MULTISPECIES: protocatechuate 3,4-dioxygenase subunit alpha [Novosphingobium]MBF7014879.1 protocatechuate 3,4-dioxygenase subunit alpha [Novosphingobium sp. HR1a]WJM24644.1 protocatechuate 3,4-dioxygenase subunit alpha [Novosphingobium resinovorum]
MTTDLETRNAAPRSDNLDPALFGQTPSQTVGPFFHYGLPWKGGADLVGASEMGARPELFPEAHYILGVSAPKDAPEGEVIALAGCVYDGNGDPVSDAMIEIWQANAAGRYCSADDPREDLAIDPNFTGFGRASTDESGVYRFRTVMPGRVPGPGMTVQAPHIAVSVFGRGVLKRLPTRLYFEGAEGNETDPVLAQVPEERRDTLIARRREDGTWWFDIVIQGERETVFFDL